MSGGDAPGPDDGDRFRRSLSVYRRLLGLYPRSLRRRHGEPMARLFRDRCRDAWRRRGWSGLGALWLRTLLDLAVNVPPAWMAAATGDRSAAPGGVDEPGSSIGRRRGGGGMDGWLGDLRYALRTLARRPGFTAVAVVTIALGIGANTAIFSVVEAVLLRPLPYTEPEELATIWTELRQRDVYDYPFSPPTFRDVREQVDAFEDVAGVFTFPQALTGDGEPEQVVTGLVSPNFFQVLGVRPALGRLFVPEDGDPGEPNPDAGPTTPPPPPTAAILGHELWVTRFGSDPSVLGQTLDIGGSRPTVVGVLPADFRFLIPPETGLSDRVAVWLASRIDYERADRNTMFLTPIARLRDGATVAQAQASAEALSARIREQFATSAEADLHLRVEPLREDLTRAVKPVLVALLGAVGFLLLIACANVSNLLLVRASARERELAVRAAVGGSRGRLVRQMLLESVIIGVVGGVLGLLVALGGIELLLLLRPQDLPRLEGVGVDGVVLGFTALLALGAPLVFGTAPALQATGGDPGGALTERSRGAGGGPGGDGRRLLQKGVVVVEVALSLVLLVGAGLMLRSFVELNRIDPGYRPEGVLTFGVNLPFRRYPTAGERFRFASNLQAGLAGIPGVEDASAVFPLPLTAPRFSGRFGPVEAIDDPSLYQQADFFDVMPGYFRTMETRLLAGRTFTDADMADSADVVVIDRKVAERLWPGPPGQAVDRFMAVRATTPEAQRVRIIGVVEHQRHPSIHEEGRGAVFYSDRWLGSFGILNWVLRTDGDPLSLVEPARARLAGLDPGLPMADVRRMTAYVEDSMASTRFTLVLIGVFALVALVLTSVGLYGVLAFVVRQRTSEIGVRIAFGASRESIMGMVLRQGMGLVAVGLAVGLGLALVSTRALRAFLVGVAPTDPATLAGIAALFAVVAALACLIPALRAMRLDPVGALREE